MIARAHRCWGCNKRWLCYGLAPDIRCVFCGSPSVTFKVQQP